MSDKDLEELCCVLNLMSQKAVARLNETELWWLPDLGGLSKRQAINSIRLALKAFDSKDARVFCIAWLYCCLAQRRALPSWDSWRSYKADASGTAWTGRFVLHELLATALRRQGCRAMGAKVEKLGRIYACVMATNPESAASQHDVIFLCVIPHCPQVFLRVDRNESGVVDALRSVLRGSYTRMLGDHVGQLRFAFVRDNDAEACRRSAVSVERELRLIAMRPVKTDETVEARQHSRIPEDQ
ncbi:hypothetical protein MTO96_002460 [Rhipicephalus appendiculatus]